MTAGGGTVTSDGRPPFLGPLRSQGLQLSLSHFHSRDERIFASYIFWHPSCTTDMSSHTSSIFSNKRFCIKTWSLLVIVKYLQQLQLKFPSLCFFNFSFLLCWEFKLLPVLLSLPAMALYSRAIRATREPQNLWHWVTTHPEFAADSLKKWKSITMRPSDRLVMHQVLSFPSSS